MANEMGLQPALEASGVGLQGLRLAADAKVERGMCMCWFGHYKNT
jgi:hypothetical protein